MTVNEYLMIANTQLTDDADKKNYGDCEIISYISDIKIRLPSGKIRTYHSELEN